MTKFLPKILIFLVAPVIVLWVVEVLLPINFFTYRIWEAISYKTNISNYSPFYSNTKIEMIGVGDLCHHTNKSILKNENWITDKYGFRNDKFVEAPDILIIGDSFIAGTSLSQDNTLTNRLISMGNQLGVYNMAPSSFSAFDYYLKTGKIKKPKLIIYSIVERNVPGRIRIDKKNLYKKVVGEIDEITHIKEYYDRGSKFSSIKWLTARFHDSKGIGKPSNVNSNMFFLEGSSQTHSAEDLKTTVTNIVSYKKYCDSLGIGFVFVPMPDKETVYFELVPFKKQPTYLFQLDSLLISANVSTINTLKVYNEYRQTSDKLLYQLDDTHWNPTATEIISKVIIDELITIPQFGLENMLGNM
jgi:alginate O-acetyltransferase complex protein AlgJ